MEPFDIYLASNSPRRRELLAQIGVRFHVLAVDVDEQARRGETPEALVQRLALAKARAGLALLPAGERRPVLGADTVVVVDGRILGKPRDEAQGLDMLARLSGRTHRVLSAVALAGATLPAGGAQRLSENLVTFRALTAQERVAYWRSGEPVDKAGAYAIQGRAALYITRLEGSYSGVMGLPLYETGELLAAAGVLPPGTEERPAW